MWDRSWERFFSSLLPLQQSLCSYLVCGLFPVDSTNQIAYIFMKPLPKQSHQLLRTKLGVLPPPTSSLRGSNNDGKLSSLSSTQVNQIRPIHNAPTHQGSAKEKFFFGIPTHQRPACQNPALLNSIKSSKSADSMLGHSNPSLHNQQICKRLSKLDDLKVDRSSPKVNDAHTLLME